MSEKTVSATPKAAKKPVARKDMSKLQWTLKEMKRNYIAYVMCAPFFLIFFTFAEEPNLYLFRTSCEVKLVSPFATACRNPI